MARLDVRAFLRDLSPVADLGGEAAAFSRPSAGARAVVAAIADSSAPPRQGARIGEGRLAHLETLRGIAALTVVLGHILAAVAVQGYPAVYVLTALKTPLAFLIDGRGAVIFFFTLSGYVLALTPLQTSNPSTIIRGAIKRWPRLAGPVILTTLVSSGLWNSGLYENYRSAAQITGSAWLAHFAYGFADPIVPPDMGFAAAVWQGAILTFLNGLCYFNPSLWTMKYEFYGSFAVFV